MEKDYLAIAERMFRLFKGREGVYATQSHDSYYPTNQDLTVDDYKNHLKGQITIAQYCLNKQDNVFFLCIDVDEKSLDAVRKVQDSAKHFGFTSYVEDTGGRGYHVWFFFEKEIPAGKVLALGRLIVEHADTGVEIEIFPKQASAAKLGNPIKLPLGCHRAYQAWSVFLGEDGKPIEDVVAFLDNIKKFGENTVDEILEVNSSDEVKVSDQSEAVVSYDRDASEMARIAEKCPFIKETLEDAEQGEHIPYPTWRGLAGVYVNFGKLGERFFHELSAKEPQSYVERECQKLLDDYKAAGHKPTSCDYFQCGRDPEKDCGLRKIGDHKQSPIRYALVKQRSGRRHSEHYKAVPIHLSHIENPKFAYQTVSTDVMVAASGNTYQVPCLYKVRARVTGHEIERQIEKSDPLLIALTKLPDNVMYSTLMKLNKAEFDKDAELEVEVIALTSIEELVLVPRATVIRSNDKGESVDETGNEYREKIVFNAGNLSTTNGYFKAVGIVVPNPKNQTATLLVTQMIPVDSDVTAFKLTETHRIEFGKFQSAGTDLEMIGVKVREILKDVTHNITRIFGTHRERVLLFVLLTLHSVLRFRFNGQFINRGWLDIIVIGDTGQGKTRQLETILVAIGIGQMVSGSTASRTGLVYNLDTVIDGKRVLKWGAQALNDGRILVVDEYQKIPEGQIEEMSTARSSGMIKVDRSVKGEHNARVRMIALANPVTGESMRSFVYGILALKFPRAADIRRFDAAICVNKDDVEAENQIYRLQSQREPVAQVITPELLRNSVLWAWKRKPDDVVFEDGADDEIMEQAKILTRKYETPEMPLVSTDTHEKLARFAVALAALLHSTDASGEQVIVRREHVLFVSQELQEVYDHPNCELNKFAALSSQGDALEELEYSTIRDKVKELIEKESYKNATSKFLKYMLQKDHVRYADISESLGFGEKAVRERMAVLVAHNLVENTKNGYRKTRKGITFLKRYSLEGGGAGA